MLPTWSFIALVILGVIGFSMFASSRRGECKGGLFGTIARFVFGLVVAAFVVIMALRVTRSPHVEVAMEYDGAAQRSIDSVLAPRIQLDPDDPSSQDGQVLRVRVHRGAKPGRVEGVTIVDGVTVPAPPQPPALAAIAAAAEGASVPESLIVESGALVETEIVTRSTTSSGPPPEPDAPVSTESSADSPPAADAPADTDANDDSGADSGKDTNADDSSDDDAPAADVDVSATRDDEPDADASESDADSDFDADAPADQQANADTPHADEEAPQSTESPAPRAAEPTPLGAPAWVRQPSGWKNGVYRVVLESDPFLTERECQRQLDNLIAVEVAQFANDRDGRGWNYFDHQTDPSERGFYARRRLQDLDLTIGRVRSMAIKDSFVENYYSENAGRTMQRVFLLLEFDEAVQKDIDQRWKEYESRKKVRDAEEALVIVCVFGGVFLAGLGALYGLLRFDTATKGYYTKRLLIGAGAATIIIVALIALNS